MSKFAIFIGLIIMGLTLLVLSFSSLREMVPVPDVVLGIAAGIGLGLSFWGLYKLPRRYPQPRYR